MKLFEGAEKCDFFYNLLYGEYMVNKNYSKEKYMFIVLYS